MSYAIVKPYGQPWKISRDGEDITSSVTRLEYTIFGDSGEKSSALSLTGGQPDTTCAVTLDVQSEQYWVLSKSKDAFWVFTAMQKTERKIDYVQLCSVLRLSVIWHADKDKFLIDVLSVWPNATPAPNMWTPGGDTALRMHLLHGGPLPAAPRKKDRFSMMVRK